MEYKRRILSVFSGIFLLLAALMVGLELRSERSSKRAVLQSRLEGYADILSNCENPTSIDSLLPGNARVTIMDKDGKVSYDSFEPSDSLGNHLARPEVQDSFKSGFGYSIRTSETTGQEYLYYAKAFDNQIVRLALPFEVDLKKFFRPNLMVILSIFLIFLVLLLLTMLLFQRYDKRNSETENRRIRELKNQMTSNISHELKTPVSSIRGYLETLTDNPDMPADKRQLFIERSYAQTLRLSDTIRDISLINKIEESPEYFKRETLNIREIVDSVFEEFADRIAAKQIWVENEVLVNSTIYGNYNLLYSLFRNLVENSVKYAGDGVKIHIDNDEVLNFRYYDTGKGVPSEHLGQLFDRFYRIDQGRSSDAGGSGLGLSIVRNAVAFHGGSISASNHQGGGLEFRFNL